MKNGDNCSLAISILDEEFEESIFIISEYLSMEHE